jgi:hypothetical protein
VFAEACCAVGVSSIMRSFEAGELAKCWGVVAGLKGEFGARTSEWRARDVHY